MHCSISFLVSSSLCGKKSIKKSSLVENDILSNCSFNDLVITSNWIPFRYCTQDMTPSGFLHSENSISPLDITILLVFIIARLSDISLVVAAIKQKSDWDKTPLLVLPWLIINALEMTLKVVSLIAKISLLKFNFKAHL